jgi:hypothetical protein
MTIQSSTLASTRAATWRRVSELPDLVETFDPGVQVCVWQREIDPSISAYLTGLERTGMLQAIETLSAEGRPRLARLPAGLEPVPGRAALIDDLAFLREIACELLGCPAVGLRLARVGHAMCPGWHIDRVGIRLICTYEGPGTQWLDDQGVDRSVPSLARMADGAYIQAGAGEVVLLKGAFWQGNERLGAIHRSPDIAPDAGARTLVTLDPLWQA